MIGGPCDVASGLGTPPPQQPGKQCLGGNVNGILPCCWVRVCCREIITQAKMKQHHGSPVLGRDLSVYFPCCRILLHNRLHHLTSLTSWLTRGHTLVLKREKLSNPEPTCNCKQSYRRCGLRGLHFCRGWQMSPPFPYPSCSLRDESQTNLC